MNAETEALLAMAPFWIMAGLCIVLACGILFLIGAKLLEHRRGLTPADEQNRTKP
ncbi:hypothetical protein LGH83_10770 [Lichenihabitans sp. PAMC28606]|uniref:hypothetical protein n=1 Tax=Lichenihabitans sp. PAMC28606 TaxID=2880932 RepID=UPI001D0AB317|nr:hypothetical protein [Lichenihabitans sp. PAMC28606]UDL93109.1 hypothetical protein LGH83_10770 [Lichenihabitans sp. PAMC28606]